MIRNFLQIFTICAVLVASYLWIRLPLWRSLKTIRVMAKSDCEVIERDLISQKADCEAAFIGLGLSAIAQGLVLFISPTIDELSGLGLQYGWIFIITLVVLFLVGNISARIREKCLRIQYYKFATINK